MIIRTRIAPSPTGDPHVGTAYIALFNYCFAQYYDGEFILRVEDTDKDRSTYESEIMILDSLRWLGITWSEGPDIGGIYGPYRQSDRLHIYHKYVNKLILYGLAFKCYRTFKELNEIKKKKTVLKVKDLKLNNEEYNRRELENYPYVIRMVVPNEGICIIQDLLRGNINIDWTQIDAQILIKSNGMPTYHFANVIDDHIMKITHVLRGEEWINSAPKHQLIYKYFGWKMPILCHMPLLRNTDKSKLSKRKNPTSINYYRRMGYLPQALINYLGHMGWSMSNGIEKFNIKDMTDNFDIHRISLGGPVFDVEKLTWLNSKYIREDFDDRALIKEICKWSFNEAYIYNILPKIRPRIHILSDIIHIAGHFFYGLPKLELKSFNEVNIEYSKQITIIQFFIWKLEIIKIWKKEEIFFSVKSISEYFKIKLKILLCPIFIAITGSLISTSVIDSILIIGYDITIARLSNAIKIMGNISINKYKKFKTEFNSVFFKQLNIWENNY
ncbi:Glutamyl-tRNA synthetase [Candidatus Johnevansia muelleri]|uniref:Glutamate--tRNA ligase n=1 Tax=Candidatus Johnevansia muelleri TaxID=1495769 RepID=A0A078KHI6_9GAMM|nr:Glutamyl-tRNA synthetase [Candidatus Evansia muelleri]